MPNRTKKEKWFGEFKTIDGVVDANSCWKMTGTPTEWSEWVCVFAKKQKYERPTNVKNVIQIQRQVSGLCLLRAIHCLVTHHPDAIEYHSNSIHRRWNRKIQFNHKQNEPKNEIVYFDRPIEFRWPPAVSLLRSIQLALTTNFVFVQNLRRFQISTILFHVHLKYQFRRIMFWNIFRRILFDIFLCCRFGFCMQISFNLAMMMIWKVEICLSRILFVILFTIFLIAFQESLGTSWRQIESIFMLRFSSIEIQQKKWKFHFIYSVMFSCAVEEERMKVLFCCFLFLHVLSQRK